MDRARASARREGGRARLRACDRRRGSASPAGSRHALELGCSRAGGSRPAALAGGRLDDGPARRERRRAASQPSLATRRSRRRRGSGACCEVTARTARHAAGPARGALGSPHPCARPGGLLSGRGVDPRPRAYRTGGVDSVRRRKGRHACPARRRDRLGQDDDASVDRRSRDRTRNGRDRGRPEGRQHDTRGGGERGSASRTRVHRVDSGRPLRLQPVRSWKRQRGCGQGARGRALHRAPLPQAGPALPRSRGACAAQAGPRRACVRSRRVSTRSPWSCSRVACPRRRAPRRTPTSTP